MIKRNLYYYIGLLSGLFLIACSDQIGDSEPSIGQGQDEGTYLFIQVGNSDQSAQTKTMAFKNLRSTETISSICVLVFNEEDVLETVGARTTLEDKSQSIGESIRGFIRAFSVNPGKKKIMLCANIGETFLNSTHTEFVHSFFREGQTLADVQALVKQYEDTNLGNEIMEHGVTRLWLDETDPLWRPCRLSLNSEIYEVEILPNKVNCLGMTDEKMNGADITDGALQPIASIRHNLDPSASVGLYFNTASVQLSKITVDVADKKAYPNARLDVTKIFVLNAKNKTKLVGKDGKAWGTTFVAENSLSGIEGASDAYSDQLVSVYKGAEVLSSTYKEKFQPRKIGETDPEALIFENECLYFLDSNCKDVSLGYPDFGNIQVPSNFRNPHGIDGTVSVEGKSGKSGRCRYGIEEFFLYENTDVNDPTLLVVQGNFTYDNPEEEGKRLSIENCYYAVKIGEGVDHLTLNTLPVGNREKGELQGLLRNVRYNITMTITQPGASSPLDVLTKSGSNNSACVAETEVTAM